MKTMALAWLRQNQRYYHVADATSGEPPLHIPPKTMKVSSTVMTARIWDNKIKGQDDAEDEDYYLQNSGAEES